jgi:2-phospho-L-lactate/phosphoenolpyruvate guanylyltransferase
MALHSQQECSPSDPLLTATVISGMWNDKHVVVVPIKSFGSAKQRLGSVLDNQQRADLARSMATHVLRQLSGLRVAVVTDDHEAQALAKAFGAEILGDTGGGLNSALTEALNALSDQGFTRATVVHADLPHATNLADVIQQAYLCADDVLLIPDRHLDGTNVMSLPMPRRFELAYGAKSFGVHLARVRACDLRPIVLIDRGFGHDVDVPGDLGVPADLG